MECYVLIQMGSHSHMQSIFTVHIKGSYRSINLKRRLHIDRITDMMDPDASVGTTILFSRRDSMAVQISHLETAQRNWRCTLIYFACNNAID